MIHRQCICSITHSISSVCTPPPPHIPNVKSGYPTSLGLHHYTYRILYFHDYVKWMNCQIKYSHKIIKSTVSVSSWILKFKYLESTYLSVQEHLTCSPYLSVQGYRTRLPSPLPSVQGYLTRLPSFQGYLTRLPFLLPPVQGYQTRLLSPPSPSRLSVLRCLCLTCLCPRTRPWPPTPVALLLVWWLVPGSLLLFLLCCQQPWCSKKENCQIFMLILCSLVKTL